VKRKTQALKIASTRNRKSRIQGVKVTDGEATQLANKPQTKKSMQAAAFFDKRKQEYQHFLTSPRSH
jgi:hypothetical protein